MTNIYQRRGLMFRFMTVGFVLLLMGAAASSAWADASVSYSLTAAENLNVLLNPNDPLVQANAAKATPFALTVARNTPFLELMNTSTTANGGTGTANLNHFELSISSSNQTFDWAQLITAQTDPGVSVTFLTPDGADNSIKNQVISMNITGLAPGKKLIFRVDLDPLNSSGSQFADYRDVFFKLDTGGIDPSAASNSTTTATFFDSSNNESLIVPDTVWENQSYPQNYGKPILGLQFPSAPHGDHVTMFPTGGAVPEPSTLILASFGGAGLLFSWRRFLRRNLAA